MNHEIKLALIRVLPFLIVIIIVFILSKRKKINPKEIDLRKPQSFKLFLVCCIGFLFYVLITEISLSYFSLLEVSKWNHSYNASLILIFGTVILAPIAEEILFRGFILNQLINKKINLHLAIFIQACFFVLLHNFTYQNTLSSNIGIAQSLIDATFFGYARIYSKSLYTPITMHITGNIIAIIERFVL